MASKEYKAIFVPQKLHADIKTRASKKGISIIAFLEHLLSKFNHK